MSKGTHKDEKNYGHHSSSSKGNISTFGAILATVGGFLGACLIFALLGVEDAPVILIIILWVVIGTILAVFFENHGV